MSALIAVVKGYRRGFAVCTRQNKDQRHARLILGSYSLSTPMTQHSWNTKTLKETILAVQLLIYIRDHILILKGNMGGHTQLLCHVSRGFIMANKTFLIWESEIKQKCFVHLQKCWKCYIIPLKSWLNRWLVSS